MPETMGLMAMGDVMILAETVLEGERYARKHGLDNRNVVTLQNLDRARGRVFDDFAVVGGLKLDVDQWASLTPAFLHAGEEVLDRLYRVLTGEREPLPPPIELARKTVLKF